MIKILLLSIYILSIITVIFIERKNPTEALLWVFVMVCLPYVGTLLYLIFGNTTTIKWRVHSRKKRLNQVNMQSKMDHLPIIHKALSQEDEQVMHFNYVYNQSSVVSYETIQVFTNGREHYKKLFEDIKNAKKVIYVEFYTIQKDKVGQAFVSALTTKAREGVSVYVLCDSFANLSTPKSFFKDLVKAGGKVIRVKPYLTHYRSHRKIVVIDSAVSYIGGMNIGNQYANLAKHKNPWRDTQVRLTGECNQILIQYFLEDWLCAVPKKDLDKTIEYVQSLRFPYYSPSSNLCQFVVGGVDTNKESVKMMYLSMISSAKERIRIQSPYFIPDRSILDALKTAAAAGVQVEIMIPGIKASFFLDPVTTYYSGQLLEYGAKIYKYDGYIHAKTMVVDDEVCAIGSVNMDIRSLTVDDEICGIFYSNSFVQSYSEIYDEDIHHCQKYTLQQFEERGYFEKFMEGFFLLFAPLM